MEQNELKTWALPFGPAPELDFEADMAQVLVMPTTAGDEPRLEVTEPDGTRVRVEVRREGPAVRVRVECLGRGGSPFAWLGWGSGRGHVRVALYVPRALRGRVHTGAGKVHVRGLASDGLQASTDAGAVTAEDCAGRLRLASAAGKIHARRLSECDLDARTDAGTIELAAVAGRVRVQTSAGKIDGEDLRGALEAETQAGAIRLRVAALDPGTHRVRTAMGSVQLELAPGLAVAIDAQARLGAARVDYPVTRGASCVLALATDMGAIRVREGASPAPAATTADAHTAAGPYRAPGATTPTSTDGSADVPVPKRADPAELYRVLEMVEQGKLSAHDAGELLRALGHG